MKLNEAVNQRRIENAMNEEQKKKNTNNCRQTTTMKTIDWATRTQL